MALTIADAEVRVTADGKKAARQVVDDFNGTAPQAGTAGSNIGKKLFAGILGAWAAIGGARMIGGFFAAGFQRLESIDNARAKLRGLGHDTQVIEGIMTNALGAVKGTAFGLDSAATVAASAVAAGIAPGDQLQRTLTLVADSATIAGGSMEEMGGIFNKVAASNRLQTEEVNQLLERGIPILKALSDQLGVSQDDVRKMVTEGKIDFETFQLAMESALGGAAQSGGETFSGAMANVRAALSRVSAGLLEGIFPQLVPLLHGIIDALGPMEEKAKDVGVAFAEWLRPGFEWVADWLANLDFTRLRDWFGEARDGAAMVLDFFTPAWSGLVSVFRDELLPRFGEIADWIADNGEVIGALGTGVGVMGAAWIVAASGVGLFTGAMGLLKTALLSHPLGWVLLVIGGIIGGLVWLEDTTRIFSTTWAALVGAVTPVWEDMWAELEPAFEELGTAFGEVWEALDPVFQLIGDAVTTLKDLWLAGLGVMIDWAVNTGLPIIVDFLTNGLVPVIVWWAERITWAIDEVIVPAIDNAVIGFNWLWDNIVVPIANVVGPTLVTYAGLVLWVFENVILPAIGKAVIGFTWLWDNIVLPIANVVGPIVERLGSIVAWIFDNVIGPVLDRSRQGWGRIWDSIVVPIIGNVMPTLERIGSKVAWVFDNVIGPVLDRARQGWGRVWETVQSVLGQIGSFVSTTAGNIIAAFSPVAGAVGNAFSGALNAARGPINSMISLVNRAIGAINGLSVTIPSFVPVVGGETFSPNLPTIPFLARGTNNAPEVFIAGEDGPELVTGAGGSTVTPYSQTRDRISDLASQGDTITIEHLTVDMSSIEDVVRFIEIIKALPDAARAGRGTKG